ncbi:MAG: hypothetical protein WDO56_06830 [Gammaproteobacteria bacterium]
MFSIAIALGSLAWNVAHAEGPSSDACAAFMPAAPEQALSVATSQQPITANDLARLRDIGPYYALQPGQNPLSVRRMAQSSHSSCIGATPVSNEYCVGLVVAGTRPDARATLLNAGGELIRGDLEFRGIAAFPSGIPSVLPPRWSPDGRSLAFSAAGWRRDAGMGGERCGSTERASHHALGVGHR